MKANNGELPVRDLPSPPSLLPLVLAATRPCCHRRWTGMLRLTGRHADERQDGHERGADAPSCRGPDLHDRRGGASPAPASASCTSMPLDEAVHRADAVWWGTVTDAEASPKGGPGVGTLTVLIGDVLKGREDPGETGQFFRGFCGGLLIPGMAKKSASRFVGEQRLFIGTYTHGGLAQMSDYFEPYGSPTEQYQLALKDLGLRQRESASPLAPFVSGGLPRWLWTVGFAVLGLMVLVLFVVARRPSQST